jgi:hypothetical protein
VILLDVNVARTFSFRYRNSYLVVNAFPKRLSFSPKERLGAWFGPIRSAMVLNCSTIFFKKSTLSKYEGTPVFEARYSSCVDFFTCSSFKIDNRSQGLLRRYPDKIAKL